MRAAVVGATGAVGREMLRILEQRAFPAEEVLAFATPRSEGRRLPFRGGEVTVRAFQPDALRGVDVALFSAGGAVARETLPGIAAAGTVCIDNSSAFRLDPEVPLVVPEINPESLRDHRGIVANANCTTITAVMPLAPLHRAFGLTSLVTSSYQSVSGSGLKGVRELLEQVEKLRGDEESLLRPDHDALPAGEVFGRTIAFNVLPRVDDFVEGGFTVEERKMRNEARRILGLPELPVTATSVRVPVLAGHGVSVHARFARLVNVEEARRVLDGAPGIRLVDDPERALYPTPLDSAGIDETLVGRIRKPEDEDDALLLFSCADNLRKGAALNAVQIAELLVS